MRSQSMRVVKTQPAPDADKKETIWGNFQHKSGKQLGIKLKTEFGVNIFKVPLLCHTYVETRTHSTVVSLRCPPTCRPSISWRFTPHCAPATLITPRTPPHCALTITPRRTRPRTR